MSRLRAVRIFTLFALVVATGPASAGCRHALFREMRAPVEWTEREVDEATLVAFETEIELALRTSTDTELKKRIAAAMRPHLESQNYLPGLTPEWNLASVDELIADIPEAQRAFGGSRFGNYYGNVAQIAQINRLMIKRAKGDRATQIQDYFRFWIEAAGLKELLRRASLR